MSSRSTRDRKTREGNVKEERKRYPQPVGYLFLNGLGVKTAGAVAGTPAADLFHLEPFAEK